MLIEEAFKSFQKSVLSEPYNTRSKKNHDYCVDIYSKTALIDLSAVYKVAETESPMAISEDTNSIQVKTVMSNTEVVLPFENCFCKVDTTHCIFIREYAPAIYTGAYSIIIPDGVLKITFTLRELEDGINSLIFQLDKPLVPMNSIRDITEKVVGEAYRYIHSLLATLQTLSPKTHDIYKVKPNRVEYMYKKVIKEKIRINRPVYIYLNKKQPENVTLPIKDYSADRLERQNSWLVRGHWRRLDTPNKRGKDSQGNYVVEGFTWVKPHKCGNKDLPVNNQVYIAV